MNNVTYKVPNISCGHCVHTIETELRELAGVTKVSADQESRMVEIDFEPPASESSIIGLLAEINYPIEAN